MDLDAKKLTLLDLDPKKWKKHPQGECIREVNLPQVYVDKLEQDDKLLLYPIINFRGDGFQMRTQMFAYSHASVSAPQSAHVDDENGSSAKPEVMLSVVLSMMPDIAAGEIASWRN